MRVGFNAVPLLAPMTGVAQYTLRLAEQLVTLLPQPPLFFYASEWSRELRAPAPPAHDTLLARLKRRVPFAYELARARQQVSFSAGVRRHPIDLYHETNYLAFRFDGPLVVTVHDLSWVRHPGTHPRDRVRHMNATMPAVLARATRVIADSEFTRREVIEHYRVDPARVVTVLLGVTPGMRRIDGAQASALLRAHGLKHGEYILAVGTLEPRKNLAAAIDAYLALPDELRRRFPLAIAGMSGWGRAPVGEARLLGYVPQDDLPALYSGARVLVYPSIYEGFGLPPLEAMACGTPVIAADRASLPEVVGDAGVLVDPADTPAFAAQMRRLLEDDAEHRRLSAAGERRAARFTWRRCAEETIAVYSAALAAA